MRKEIEDMINSFHSDEEKAKKQNDVVKNLIEKYYFKNQFNQISIDSHVNDLGEIIMQNIMREPGFIENK